MFHRNSIDFTAFTTLHGRAEKRLSSAEDGSCITKSHKPFFISSPGGKSTIFKQMRILHGKPQSASELLRFRDIIRSNCLMLMVALSRFVHDQKLTVKGRDEKR